MALAQFSPQSQLESNGKALIQFSVKLQKYEWEKRGEEYLLPTGAPQ
jgi:hypothetical protein